MASSNSMVVGGATVTIGADLGYIKDGITQTPSIESFMPEGIEQLTTPPRSWITKRGFEISFTLIEPTLANIKIGWDITEATVVGTPPAPTTLVIGALASAFKPQQRVLAITGQVPGVTTFVRTVTYHKAVITSASPLIFKKDEETNCAMTMVALYDDVTNNRVGQFSDATA